LPSEVKIAAMSQLGELISSDGTAGDYMGLSVALSGDTLVVGAPSNASQGAAYVFVKP
jgi:hypothetical protein